MSTISDDIDKSLGARVKLERESRGWSLSDLAKHSGVSRAMIHRVERGDVSATAALLGRLSGAFGITLSTLLARAEAHKSGRLTRAKDQARWIDPGTGYVRRQVTPGSSNLPIEIVEIKLPSGASVTFPAAAYLFIRQVVWVLDGRLTLTEGATTHRLGPGDCLEFGEPAECTFENKQARPCTYVVFVLKTK
jgi:transcriptional regulator with XRE-family HTH domain